MKQPLPKDILAFLPVEQIVSRFDLQKRIAKRDEWIVALAVYSVLITLLFLGLCTMF